MGTGYTRKDTSNNIANGNVIDADDLDAEFNGIEDAFNSSTGHTHDGTSAEGAPIEVTGPNQEYVSDATALYPKTDDTYDLGKTGAEWKDLYIDGTANIDSLVADTADINGGTIDGATIGGSSAGAGTFTNLTASGTVNLSGATVSDGGSVTTVDINGGTIDGTVIGGTTPAAISGTTGQFGTSLNVDGTITSDGLTVEQSGADVSIASRNTNNSSGTATSSSLKLGITSTVGVHDSEIKVVENSVNDNTTRMEIYNQDGGVSKRNMQILGNGDISFYEDTGTTPKFFWDASAESLGIGTSSPDGTMHVFTASAGAVTADSAIDDLVVESNASAGISILTPNNAVAQIAFGDPDDNNVGRFIYSHGSNYLATHVNGSEAMRIDSSGNLLVGKTSSGYSVNGAEITSTGLMYLPAGSASAPALTFSGDTNTGIGFGGADILYMSTGGSERMRIDSSGNVGIGTSSPAELLHVDGNAAFGGTDRLTLTPDLSSFASGLSRLQLSCTGNSRPLFEVKNTQTSDRKGALISAVDNQTSQTIQMVAGGTANSSTTQPAINVTSNHPLVFMTNDSERMRIDSSGNLLVGKTTTDDTVQGAFYGNNRWNITASNGPTLLLNRHSSDGDLVIIRRNNTTVGSITVTTSATAYNTSSDYRLKEDVQPMTGASDRLMALKPVNFAWKADGTRVDGFLAHEAQEVVPEAVTGTKDAVDDEGNPEYQGIDQSKLVPVLTAALQEALTEIASLKARLDAANL